MIKIRSKIVVNKTKSSYNIILYLSTIDKVPPIFIRFGYDYITDVATHNYTRMVVENRVVGCIEKQYDSASKHDFDIDGCVNKIEERLFKALRVASMTSPDYPSMDTIDLSTIPLFFKNENIATPMVNDEETFSI